MEAHNPTTVGSAALLDESSVGHGGDPRRPCFRSPVSAFHAAPRKMNVHWPDRADAVLKSPAKESRTPQRFGIRRPLLGGLGGEGGRNIPVNKGDLRTENAALREENEALRKEGRSMHRDLAEFQKLLDKYDHMVRPPWREAGPPNHHDDKVDSDQ